MSSSVMSQWPAPRSPGVQVASHSQQLPGWARRIGGRAGSPIVIPIGSESPAGRAGPRRRALTRERAPAWPRRRPRLRRRSLIPGTLGDRQNSSMSKKLEELEDATVTELVGCHGTSTRATALKFRIFQVLSYHDLQHKSGISSYEKVSWDISGISLTYPIIRAE